MVRRPIQNHNYSKGNIKLTDVLTQDQIESGLYLREDEDFVYLCDKDGITQAVFVSRGATIEAIREEADKFL